MGASSSGKSAFTRAVRTLTSNARGTSFITHGERTCTITAQTDRGIVSLSKGAKDEYTVIPKEGEQKTFTKLAGDVPEAVTELLGIPAKEALNFAGQFDMPYLLKSSPGEVARVLGELTNADIVFSAARESNRRRLQAAGTLRSKADDLEGTRQRSLSYVNLRAQLDAIATAEHWAEQADEANKKAITLADLLRRFEDALARHATLDTSTSAEIPSAAEAEQEHARLNELLTLLRATTTLKGQVEDYERAQQVAVENIELLEQEYLAELHALGTCPTCGASTKGVHHAV